MFTQDQLDALQELINIAMGQSADKLARLINAFVVLSVPKLHAVDSDADQEVQSLLKNSANIRAQQSFSGALRGEVIVFFGANGANELHELMGYQSDTSTAQIKEELILDVTNILVGACINGLTQQLSLNRSAFSTPRLLGSSSLELSASPPNHSKGREAFLVEIMFAIETHAFCCELLLCIDTASIPIIIASVNSLLYG